MITPDLRRVLGWIHLYGGLVGAAFLSIAGVTGGVLAFAPELDHLLYAEQWRVTPGLRPLAEQALADSVRRRDGTGPATRLRSIAFEGPGRAQVFALANGTKVFVDPGTAEVRGLRRGPTALDELTSTMFQLHVRLLAGNPGQWIVDVATALLLLLVGAGLCLWWPRRRVTVAWGQPGRRFTWDLHNTVGAFASLSLIALATSGLLLASDAPLEWLTGSQDEPIPRPPHSTPPADRPASDADLDKILEAADRALPRARTMEVDLPVVERSAVRVVKCGPGGLGRSTVFLDRHDARVLRVDDFRLASRVDRAHQLDESVHMGDLYGAPMRVVMGVTSFALALLAVTGVVLGGRRLARLN